jgi:hypothetical protein
MSQKKSRHSEFEGLRSRLEDRLAPLRGDYLTAQDRACAVRLSLRLCGPDRTFKEVDRAVAWLYGVSPYTIKEWRRDLGHGQGTRDDPLPGWTYRV